MEEEYTKQPSSHGKSRRERVEYARSRAILDVASELNMELFRSGRDYRWKEHDSMVITPEKNMWNWFSRRQGGDVIALVQTMREVNFNQAIDYLNDGTFKEFYTIERSQESFNYYLEAYEQPFEAARSYLKEQRSLSDETVNFFLKKGVLAQANAKVNGSIEPVLVFKSFDFSGELVGATLQGIEENWEKWPEHGYAKNILRNSDGITGLHVDIGHPNRLIFAESAIDLMSYYELHQDELQDVRLVSMDGLKEGVVGRHLAQLQSDIKGRPLRWSQEQLAEGLQVAIDKNFFEDETHADWITLAVDNDESGRNFIDALRKKGAVITEALPTERESSKKTDWNDTLKHLKEKRKVAQNQDSTHVDFQKKVTDLISEITNNDETYYLWHDFELTNLNVSDVIIEDFHKNLENTHYQIAGSEVYVEASANDGATGFLSIEGHALDENGIRDYLSNQEFSEIEQVKFLTTLQTELPDVWNNVSHHYDQVFEEVLVKYNLIEKHADRSQDQELELHSLVVPEAKEKSLDINQETNTGSEQEKKNETILGDLSEQAQEAAPVPEVITSQPLKDLSPSQSESHSLLHFTIRKPSKSIYKQNYHVIDEEDLLKLNNNAEIIQNSAKWYLDNLADRTIHYFYQKESKIYDINLHFEKRHYMHLTGIFPIKKGQTAEKTLFDFATGRGDFDNIMISNRDAAFQKIKALPDMKAILNTKAFYFDGVEDIPKLHALKMEQAIQSDDKDILLALQSNGENLYPASLMEVTQRLRSQLEGAEHANSILGIYSEQGGVITPVSINHHYIQDNGAEMLSILQNRQYEEQVETSQSMSQEQSLNAEIFTQVLDTVYHIGEPRILGTQIAEELKATWERYYELSDSHDGNFSTVVKVADKLGLVDKESNFYQEWLQDSIYNETYHIRLQSLENWPDGPQIPFKETEIVEYQRFAQELYKQNKAFYERHQESISTENQANYMPLTKVKFDVYAPGGMLIKENVHYGIGDEAKPISRLLGLGYRRLEGQAELAVIDEKVLSQLENQKVNQEIATEANEQLTISQAIVDEEKPRGVFKSPDQDLKTGLAQRVEEIMNEDTVRREHESNHPAQEQSSSVEPFDYQTASAYDISEHAFQKIREYTKSPEDLLEYINFMSKFPQLSPRNVALIHDQWPGANAVATYDQWQGMGEALGIKADDVIQTKATYINKRTGESKEVVHQGLSVKIGEKSKITLFRPLMVKMIPVLDDSGNQVKNNKGNPKFKKLSQASSQEKTLVKEGKLPVRQFQDRDTKTGHPRFTTYKVFELSQTSLKPESYPKAMPNRHYNFNMDKVKTKEVLEGLCDYAQSIGVKMMKDEAHILGNAKGAFFPGEQLILINPDNTPGEKIATTIHELAHATLHNPKLEEQYKELPKGQKEFEAEMTSHLLSKHFGLDTTEKAVEYMAAWTDKLTSLDDKQLTDSLKRVHKTVSKMLKQVEGHTKPYQVEKNRGNLPNFPKAPTKGAYR
ncbi:PBECR4 domain-containing protein [Streptococcus iniae]|nr:toprim [Streptococcus iniae]